MFISEECPDCNGTGEIDSKECETCGGMGTVEIIVGEPGEGEQVCPDCEGTGEIDGETCIYCGGDGVIPASPDDNIDTQPAA